VLAQMVTKMVAELAAGLPALLMKRAPIAGAEAEAESAGWWGEWWSCLLIPYGWTDRCMRFRYVNDISDLSRCNDYFRRRSSMALTSQRAQSASVAWAAVHARAPRSRRRTRRRRPIRWNPAGLSSRFTSASACSATRDHVLAGLFAADFAEQKHPQPPGATKRGSSCGSVTQRRSSARPASVMRYFLTAPRADVGHLDQPASASLFSSPYS